MPLDDRQNIPAQIHLEPVAAPSILGLYGYAAATFIVSAHLAGWYGNSRTALVLFPFAAMLGGLAQFTAGMWAYKARDGVATAMHGIWGALFLAYGMVAVMMARGTIVAADLAPAVGFWFCALTLITAAGAYAAMSENSVLAIVWAIVAIGSACASIAGWSASGGWMALAAWVFILSSIVAWYAGSALMLEGAFGRAVWPLGMRQDAMTRSRVEFGMGEPGVIRGQA